jgi:hypothetical protein
MTGKLLWAAFAAGAIAIVVAIVLALTDSGSKPKEHRPVADPLAGFRKAAWLDEDALTPAGLGTVRRLGVRIVEVQVPWYGVAKRRPARPDDPADPAYRWSATLDRGVRLAEKANLQVLFMPIGTPRWANGGQAWNRAPTHPGDYADFVSALSRRYPSVRLWMVWGEPNRGHNFVPTQPRRYAALLDDAYGALKRVNPANVVIGGNTFPGGTVKPLSWVAGMRLADGRAPRLDVYGHNPFTNRTPELGRPPISGGYIDFSALPTLARAVDRHWGRPVRFFLSEFTIPTDRSDHEFNFWVSRATQARWIRLALRGARRSPRIAGLGWIHLRDTPPLTSSGLLDARGRPKLGFHAFARG